MVSLGSGPAGGGLTGAVPCGAVGAEAPADPLAELAGELAELDAALLGAAVEDAADVDAGLELLHAARASIPAVRRLAHASRWLSARVVKIGRAHV